MSTAEWVTQKERNNDSSKLAPPALCHFAKIRTSAPRRSIKKRGGERGGSHLLLSRAPTSPEIPYPPRLRSKPQPLSSRCPIGRSAGRSQSRCSARDRRQQVGSRSVRLASMRRRSRTRSIPPFLSTRPRRPSSHVSLRTPNQAVRRAVSQQRTSPRRVEMRRGGLLRGARLQA